MGKDSINTLVRIDKLNSSAEAGQEAERDRGLCLDRG